MSGQAPRWGSSLPPARSYGVASAGERASPASSLFKYGKPNTPESSKLLGEQHLQTASGRAIIRAVGASILPDTGTYRVGQEKSPHGANMGLSGKVLYLRKSVTLIQQRAALRLPYLLGTPATMSGQATRWDSSTRGAAYLLQILRRVASAPGQRAGSILSLLVLLPEPTKGRLIYSLLGYI